MKTMHALFNVSLTALILFAFASCEKDSTAIAPDVNPIQAAAVTGINPDVGTTPLNGGEVEPFEAKGEFTIYVNRAGAGSSLGGGARYILTAEGTSESPKYGTALTTFELLVNIETGEAQGTINYDFAQQGLQFEWRLSGQLSKTPNSPESELLARLVSDSSPFDPTGGPSGRATTIISGDVYYLIQRAGQFDAVIGTIGYVIL